MLPGFAVVFTEREHRTRALGIERGRTTGRVVCNNKAAVTRAEVSAESESECGLSRLFYRRFSMAVRNSGFLTRRVRARSLVCYVSLFSAGIRTIRTRSSRRTLACSAGS